MSRGSSRGDPLNRKLAHVRNRWRCVRGAEDLLIAALFALFALVAGFAADNLFALSSTLRTLYILLAVSGLLALTARLLLRFFRGITNEGAALLLEQAHPEAKNRFINAVLLAKSAHRNSPFLPWILEDARNFALRLARRRAISLRILRGLGIALCTGLFLFAAYRIVLPVPFLNAFERFKNPSSGPPALSKTLVSVCPGDITLLRGTGFAVRAVPSGAAPAGLILLVSAKGGEEKIPLDFTGDSFSHCFEKVLADFSYRVEANGFKSPLFQVDVVDAPRVENLTLSFHYPPYSGLPERTEEHARGDIAALEGTRVVLSIEPDRPVREGRLAFQKSGLLPLEAGGENILRGEFTLKESDRYTIELKNPQGLKNPHPPLHSVRVLSDEPPQVILPLPGCDRSLTAGEDLALGVEAVDDVGLKRVQIHWTLDAAEGAAAGAKGRTGIVAQWDLEPGVGRMEGGGLLQVSAMLLRAGSLLRYFAVAEDRAGNRAQSRVYAVRILAGEADRDSLRRTLLGLLERIRAIFNKQMAAYRGAARLYETLNEIKKRPLRETLGRLEKAQAEILEETRGVISLWDDPILTASSVRKDLEDLAQEEMTEVLGDIRNVSQAPEGEKKERLSDVLSLQESIIEALRKILEEGRLLDSRIRSGDLEGMLPELAQGTEPVREKVREALEELRSFTDAQEKIIEATESLKGTEPEDFTDEEDALLEELKGEEENWGKVLKDLSEDFSKLHPQDFSDSFVARELLEAFSEVELAADALERKVVEIAVPFEQSGLELAEEITENLERWLADVPDKIKWNMEEPIGDTDVPMADLPEELEDIIGELIDSEEALTEETEDVTSGWLDSLNEGAGWTAMDGPISNMSAKGVTGNLLPNSHEVGGRSGEGRSGRSHGQMVEESAAGKGGRQTPTRYIPDPFEGGAVKDSGRDPEGGATGGGKLSGTGKEGLRGIPSPEVRARMRQMADIQMEIRQQAERLSLDLSHKRYYPEDLRNALDLMQRMEKNLRLFRKMDYISQHRQILERLQSLKKVVAEKMRHDRDTSSMLPEEIRRGIRNALEEPMPEEYSEIIKAYYRSLSEIRRRE